MFLVLSSSIWNPAPWMLSELEVPDNFSGLITSFLAKAVQVRKAPHN